MKKNVSTLALSTLTLGDAFCGAGHVAAQVAGAMTALGVSVVEATQVAMGCSAWNTRLRQAIYNDAGQKVGDVDDLINSADEQVSCGIVGAAGFLGIGRHDVAIPVAQMHDKTGKLVMNQRHLMVDSRVCAD